MKISRGLTAYARQPFPVLTIGNFDGQHVGHRALLQMVVRRAEEIGGTPMVLTFDPHPIMVLAPQVALQFLTSKEEKLARFEEAEIAEVIVLEFTPALAALSPDQFVSDILVAGIGVKELFVGEHFRFGKERAGRITDLTRFGAAYGFTVHPVAPVSMDGTVVSSTLIRKLIQSGDVREAARGLGRGYTLSGTVGHGAQRGQSMGWPTANLRLPAGRVIPPDGVYATKTVWRGAAYDSVSYIGTRPTFGAGERLLEVSLLDTEVDLYGQEIAATFIDRVRGDEVFQSADELAIRIRSDVERAREALRTWTMPLQGGGGRSA